MIEPKESIYTIVTDKDGNEKTLEIVYDADTLSFMIEGVEVFGGDWTGNFANVFKRALNVWDGYIAEYD